jgi:phage baseplate assembly protein V
MRALIDLVARVAEIERRLSAMMRHGTVAQINPATQTVRLRFGDSDGGGDFLSPPVPYSQAAGALKVHSPPTVGQQMTIMAPGGDLAQGVAMPMGFSDANPAPSSAGDRNVITFGAVTLTLRSDGLTAAVGGVTLDLSAGGLAITGGAVTHNGTNIGSSHVHGGITPGPSDTDPPH